MNSVYRDFKDLKKALPLNNYYYFENEFTLHDIQRVMELYKKTPKVPARTEKDVNLDYRKSTIAWITCDPETRWLFDKIAVCVRKANQKMWNFGLVGFGEEIQITEYKEGDKYDWHMDIGADADHRKISVSVQLSRPCTYEGGDLEFLFRKNIEQATRKEGAAVVFPAYLMHRVTELTKGTRYSLICWISGEPFH